MNLELTPTEASVLLLAAQSIAEDIESYGLTGPEKAAYQRAMAKLREAVRREPIES